MGFYTGILIKSSPPKGEVHRIQVLIRELFENTLRNFFGEEMGGVRGTQTPRCFGGECLGQAYEILTNGGIVG